MPRSTSWKAGYAGDPLYADIERIVYRNGGWQSVANQIGLTAEALKRQARTLGTRRPLRDYLYLHFVERPRLANKRHR